MDSPLTTNESSGFILTSSTPPPVSIPAPPAQPQTPLPPSSPGIGAVPWIAGVACLLICWPLGIPALITAWIARSASRERADAVEADNLYEAARLLARSRHYRSMSLGCSALGVAMVLALLLLIAVGNITGLGFW